MQLGLFPKKKTQIAIIYFYNLLGKCKNTKHSIMLLNHWYLQRWLYLKDSRFPQH